MKCSQCSCKFKEKHQRWHDREDGTTVIICPKCKKEIPIEVEEETKDEHKR